MIKKFGIALLAIISTSAFADHVPPSKKYNTSTTGLRIFKKLDKKITLMGEAAYGEKYAGKTTSNLKFGSYYKLQNKQKLGFFISNQTGVRHNNDWVKKNGDWFWQNTSHRSEQSAHLVYTKRFIPNFRKPFVIELKNEFTKNFFNQDEIYIFKPAFYWFHLKNARPIWSVNISFPLYIPMNFKAATLYKKGIYVGGLYHISKRYQLSLSYRHLQEIWTEENDDFKRTHPTESYEVTDEVNTIALDLILQF